MKNEPVISRAAVAAVIATAVVLLKAFGVEVSAELADQIVNVAFAVAPIAAIAWAAFSARKRVVPVAKVDTTVVDDGAGL